MHVSFKWTTPVFGSLKLVPVEDVGLIPNTLGLPVVVPVPVPVPVPVGVVGVKVDGVPVVGVVVVGVPVVPVPALLQMEAKKISLWSSSQRP